MRKFRLQEGVASISKFYRTAEELREFVKENNIKLSKLLEYLKRRNCKKIQKGDK